MIADAGEPSPTSVGILTGVCQDCAAIAPLGIRLGGLPALVVQAHDTPEGEQHGVTPALHNMAQVQMLYQVFTREVEAFARLRESLAENQQQEEG